MSIEFVDFNNKSHQVILKQYDTPHEALLPHFLDYFIQKTSSIPKLDVHLSIRFEGTMLIEKLVDFKNLGDCISSETKTLEEHFPLKNHEITLKEIDLLFLEKHLKGFSKKHGCKNAAIIIEQRRRELLYYFHKQVDFDREFFTQAMLNFSSSYAGWCFLGWIFELGDRHLENIMIHESNAKTALIDFELMFDRGKDLKVPEMVKFRMTDSLQIFLGFFGLYGGFKSIFGRIGTEFAKEGSVFMEEFYNLYYYILEEESKDDGDKRLCNLKRNLLESFEKLQSKVAWLGSHEWKIFIDTIIADSSNKNTLYEMFIGWDPMV